MVTATFYSFTCNGFSFVNQLTTAYLLHVENFYFVWLFSLFYFLVNVELILQHFIVVIPLKC